MNSDSRWKRFLQTHYRSDEMGLELDISRMSFPSDLFDQTEVADVIQRMSAALARMDELEQGSVANPTEGRQVGHYWLRTPELAPDPAVAADVIETVERIKAFASAVHRGARTAVPGRPFRKLLLIGIGGSALGPQVIADCLAYSGQPIEPYFLDNTDPAGIHRVLSELTGSLAETLVIVASKSGRTTETLNGMIEARVYFGRAGLDFNRHAVAITEPGSQLWRLAETERWQDCFPVWQWVGGRTSLFSSVGILPAALMGFDIEALVAGGRQMDAATRNSDPRRNPAALLAMMWHVAGEGLGQRDMVILPYCDRLQLLPRYLQQLVMESLGKEKNLDGESVFQGIVVYGNKGSTDQHSYIQQLRQGPKNYFATFVEVLNDGDPHPIDIRPGITTGDFLNSFLQGTRRALTESTRDSLTLTLEQVDAATLGRVVALYDRAVGLYAYMINVNAYDQPGVEAGKLAAERVIDLQTRVVEALRGAAEPVTAAELAMRMSVDDSADGVEGVYHVLRRLAQNASRGVRRIAGPAPDEDRFKAV